MISRRDAILASFGSVVLGEATDIRFAEREENQIIYVLRHPNDELVFDGKLIHAAEVARTIVENIRPGSRVTLPNDVDHRGEYCWNLKVFDLRNGKMREIPDSLKEAPVSRTEVNL